MHFDPHHYRQVMHYINYFAGQANAVKRMALNKRSQKELSVMLLAAISTAHALFPVFYGSLYDTVIDFTNTLLDHPELDEPTRSKVQAIRVSASDMEAMQLAKTIEELERLSKLLP